MDVYEPGQKRGGKEVDRPARSRGRLASPARPIHRATSPERSKSAGPAGATPPVRRQSRAKKSGPAEQLRAAAATVVWFASWFQEIYDEIVGRGE